MPSFFDANALMPPNHVELTIEVARSFKKGLET
jgi:hypothetical protein